MSFSPKLIFRVNSDRTVADGMLGDFYLNVQGTRLWTDATWDEHIENVKAIQPSIPPWVMVYSGANNPNATQRRRVADAFKDRGPGSTRVAILSDSATSRITMTAISLVFRILKNDVQFQGYRVRDASSGLAWLATPAPAAQVLDSLLTLVDAVGYPAAAQHALRAAFL
jgi:hypothetical protein